MNELNERLANSLRRAPYVWLAATVLLFLVMDSVLVPIAEEPGDGSNLLAVGSIVFIVWTILSWTLIPRVLRSASPTMRLIARWTYAVIPFIAAYSSVAAGGEQWAFAIGFITSVVLLVLTARRTAREAREPVE
jgi:hypothetical protein